MGKSGRNSPCPCGSGKKYKRCCEKRKPNEGNQLPPGRFRYEAGSYGGPGRGYVPSIIGYKEVGPYSWTEHLCLVLRLTILDCASPSLPEGDLPHKW